MLESIFQSQLKKDLRARFPGCEIIKNDATAIQGICDLLILYKDRWAMLEVKKNKSAIARPNQPFYVEKFNRMSFAAFIFPENKEQILNELEQSFNSRR